MLYINLPTAKKELGFSYLGSVSKTVKHKKSIKFGEYTYSLYLSPAKTSGYEVCPGRTKECTALCLHESGMNRMSMKDELITKGRINRTVLFHTNRDYFMSWMVDEIRRAKTKADSKGFNFSVRLNNTSDISPEEFVLDGKNILQIFPDVQFYDYTKVKDRIPLADKYPNYHLTYSYTGYNEKICKEMLSKNINVAVVFKSVPESFWGYEVINGDISDLRTKDKKGVIVGLKFKKVRNQPDINTKFVV